MTAGSPSLPQRRSAVWMKKARSRGAVCAEGRQAWRSSYRAFCLDIARAAGRKLAPTMPEYRIEDEMLGALRAKPRVLYIDEANTMSAKSANAIKLIVNETECCVVIAAIPELWDRFLAGSVQEAAQLINRCQPILRAPAIGPADVKLFISPKTAGVPGAIAKIAAAAALNDRIWREARREMKPGMTEKDIQRIIRAWMNALGDGEAFETIVCVGKNAAECHHVPDGTVWRKGEALLVDMGVKLDGYCSDMTRCVPGTAGRRKGIPSRYDEIYSLVLGANRAAVAAVKPGITGKKLDAVARCIIRKAGFGKCFGHALGHGVGLEIHEMPVASKRSKTMLKPGMVVTIEPGVYIEGELGVRIEDLVLVTKDGCEVLSSSPK